MFEIVCTEEIWLSAEKIAESLPIYENSHREKLANQVGSLGEVLAEHWFKLNSINFKDERFCTTHDYRFSNGKTVDVKTKDRKVKPLPEYDCSVPLYNHNHQRPDYYLFVSLKMDKNDNSKDIRRFNSGFILGGANIHYLDKWGVHWKAGQVDEANGTRFWTDCINIKIKYLASLEKSIEAWKYT
jgi:hypothetical protein